MYYMNCIHYARDQSDISILNTKLVYPISETHNMFSHSNVVT